MNDSWADLVDIYMHTYSATLWHAHILSAMLWHSQIFSYVEAKSVVKLFTVKMTLEFLIALVLIMCTEGVYCVYGLVWIYWLSEVVLRVFGCLSEEFPAPGSTS